MTRRIRVVLVDSDLAETAIIRRLLEGQGDLHVAAVAGAAAEAVRAVARERPDVLVMALGLSGGQAAVERIMSEHPTPILVLSPVASARDTAPAVRALAAGAVEAMPKPERWEAAAGEELRRQVRRVAAIPVIRRRAPAPARPAGRRAAPARRAAPGPVVAVAASTGGPPALATMLAGLDGVRAPILVVQHIHPSFADGFAAWLAGASGRDVQLAADGTPAAECVVYVAPGEAHLRLGADRRLVVSEEPRALHRPSADVLMTSVAEAAGRHAVGVVLTGMGEDGAAGLLAIRRAGGCALAQDEATSAVYGMPRAAARQGAVERSLPLAELAGAVRSAVEGRR